MKLLHLVIYLSILGSESAAALGLQPSTRGVHAGWCRTCFLFAGAEELHQDQNVVTDRLLFCSILNPEEVVNEMKMEWNTAW